MRINNAFLKNVDSYNDFAETDVWVVQEGQANTLQFRTVDLDREGLRFIPGSGATVVVTFAHADGTSPDIVKTATQKFDPEDRSIFELSLGVADVPASGNVKFKLTDGADEYQWLKEGAVNTKFLNVGSC